MKHCSLHLCCLHSSELDRRKDDPANFALDLADEAGAEADSQNSLVAPLLQRVAADVQHFVKSCGYTRMPTRGEMREAGGSCSCNACYLLLSLTALQCACFSAIPAMHQALVALRCREQLADPPAF